jgi:hypothetical protein
MQVQCGILIHTPGQGRTGPLSGKTRLDLKDTLKCTVEWYAAFRWEPLNSVG